MKLKLALLFVFMICLAGAAVSSDVPALIADGDSLYHLFDNSGAEAKYVAALDLEPENAEILWRLSRAMVDIGEHLPEAEQEAYFTAGLDYADKTIAADAENPEGHLRRAIALGKIALFKGVFKSISLVKQVKASLETCLSLDPEEPTAHFVLARTHQKLTEKPKFALKILGLSWADKEISKKEYLRAIELDDTFIMYRYNYAKLLIEMGAHSEAKTELERVMELPIRDEDDADLKEKADAILSKQR